MLKLNKNNLWVARRGNLVFSYDPEDCYLSVWSNPPDIEAGFPVATLDKANKIAKVLSECITREEVKFDIV